jgi:hypothetical protein
MTPSEETTSTRDRGTQSADVSVKRRGVTARSLVLGFALIPLNVLFVTGLTWRRDDFTGWYALFHTSVAVLFALALFNRGLLRWRPRWTFSAGEMLTVYILVGISTGLVSVVWAWGGALAGTIAYPFWYATASNQWDTLLWPNLPSWLTVQGYSVLEGFFAGSSTMYRLDVIRAWAVPALWWTTFVSVLMVVCLSLNSVVRHRWEDEEKLPFPYVTVPLELADTRQGLLHSRLFWIGCLFTLGLATLNSVSNYVPSVPGIPLSFRFFQAVAGRHPWDAIPFPVMTLMPWIFGLIYLIPLEMTLSLFVFDMLWNVEYVLASQLGWNTTGISGFPYGQDQSTGGFIAVIVIFLWLDRRYFLQVLRRSLGLRSAIAAEHEEASAYRTALLLALLGTIYLWWFLQRAGMAGWVVPAFLGGYLLAGLGLSRLRAQVGPPSHALQGMMPDSLLTAAFGSRGLGPRTISMFGLLTPYTRQQWNSPVPFQLESLRMASGGRMQRRRLAIAMTLAVPLTMVCYFWVSMHYGYLLGVGTAQVNREVFTSVRYIYTDMDERVRYPSEPMPVRMLAMGVGFLFTVALQALRLRFSWWPVHPAAFPLCLEWVMQEAMVPLFIMWVGKLILLRYGGLKAYRAGLPLFLGFFAGDATAAVIRGLLFSLFSVRW